MALRGVACVAHEPWAAWRHLRLVQQAYLQNHSDIPAFFKHDGTSATTCTRGICGKSSMPAQSAAAPGAVSGDRGSATATSTSMSTATSTVHDSSGSSSMSVPHLDFNDYRAVFSGRTTGDLLRAYLVLQACSISPLVRHAERLIAASRRLLGDGLTFKAVRATFFKQFCAGEDEASMWPTINLLRAHGIRSIIDYAAEDDVPSNPSSSSSSAAQQPSSSAAATDGSGSNVDAATSSSTSTGPSSTSSSTQGSLAPSLRPQQGVVGRTYDYESEAKCDHHVGIFLRAIDTVAKLQDHSFAAIKVTALGNPQLLERMSAALMEIRTLFAAGDADGDGFVSRQEFESLYLTLFPSAPPSVVSNAFATLDVEGAGRVDLISWTHRIRLQDMPQLVERIRTHGAAGPLSSSLLSVGLTPEEVELAEAMVGRVNELAAAAAAQGVRLMVDAEHTYFQPSIDHTVKALCLEHNRDPAGPVVFNTYQAYLKDSRGRLLEDMERARREGYTFAAKLVRGAYLQLERRRAAQRGYPTPVWDTLQQTHDNFDACVADVLDEVAARGAHLMVASHNQASIEKTVAGMAARGLAPSGPGVYFGQLLGMADNLTFTLGQAGYSAFKYVTYGPVELVMPYLVRRAQENSAIMGPGVARQLDLLAKELRRRLLRG